MDPDLTALSLVGWGGLARLMRAITLGLRLNDSGAHEPIKQHVRAGDVHVAGYNDRRRDCAAASFIHFFTSVHGPALSLADFGAISPGAR